MKSYFFLLSLLLAPVLWAQKMPSLKMPSLTLKPRHVLEFDLTDRYYWKIEFFSSDTLLRIARDPYNVRVPVIRFNEVTDSVSVMVVDRESNEKFLPFKNYATLAFSVELYRPEPMMIGQLPPNYGKISFSPESLLEQIYEKYCCYPINFLLDGQDFLPVDVQKNILAETHQERMILEFYYEHP